MDIFDLNSDPPSVSPDPQAPPSPTPPSPSLPLVTMPPPPEGIEYRTPQLGIEHMNQFAEQYGYSVSTERSKHNTVYVCCTRGRKPRDRHKDKERKRVSTSIAMACPFSVILKLKANHDAWVLEHRVISHNHEPIATSTHAIHRKRELTAKLDSINAWIKRGLDTRFILTSLREEDPYSCIIA
ncbi:uncharacterized protein N7503_001215 [Penicillium pulvis]|uniref:uncharacterized protein n=1 Tax=Penicillium pulvis TaxID=1562058 RepID=UPI0025485EF1|nr:uncharacterized protein N7503_001215 [Penicillium pulvis]KAJ5814465.1 hypothetical protein N7503_001215 [Penicillium pulvis]